MASKKTILLVVNPVSGGKDKAAIIDAAKTRAEELGYAWTEYETDGKDDVSSIRSLYREHKPSRVLIAGGDGTIKMAAEALQDQDVVIGILPAGSANGLAVDLGFPPRIEEFIDIAFGDRYQELDMVLINGHRSLHLSDLGLNAELIKNYEQSNLRGKLGYALQTVNTLTDDPVVFKAEVKANGKTTRVDTKLIIVANSQKYGTGVVVNPFGSMDDGKFEIVLFRNLDLITVGKIIAGNIPLDTGEVEIIAASKATITTDIPVHFQIDGEYCGEVSRIEIAILQRQLKVAVPNP